MVQRYEQMRRLQWYKCGADYEQLEQLERLPENHFSFNPVTGTPEVPISSRKPQLRLSVITLAANDAQLVGGTQAEVLEGEVL